MHLANYLGLLHRSLDALAAAYRQVASAHGDEPDVDRLCERFAGQCHDGAARLRPFADAYGEDAPAEPERFRRDLFTGTRTGHLGLVRDLHDLYLMATECDITWTIVGQAAQAARDRNLLAVVTTGETSTAAQLAWLRTRIKQSAPQALVVAR